MILPALETTVGHVTSEHVQYIPQCCIRLSLQSSPKFAECFRTVEKKKSDLNTEECSVVCFPSLNIQHEQKWVLLTLCLAGGVYTSRAV